MANKTVSRSRCFIIKKPYKIGEIIPIYGRWKQLAKQLSPPNSIIKEIKAGVCLGCGWIQGQQDFIFTYELVKQ